LRVAYKTKFSIDKLLNLKPSIEKENKFQNIYQQTCDVFVKRIRNKQERIWKEVITKICIILEVTIPI